ncbi:MAG: MarR family winged helix-turn-helix transcriptional regulator [Gemmatimonas sp.]
MSGKGEKKRRRALTAYSRLQRAASLSAARVDQAVNTFGLSASQLGVLEVLDERGSLHQQELVRALGRSKAQMTSIVDTLEKRGAVRRERHATDRRYMTVHLTETGIALLNEAAPVRAEAIVTLMRELSGDQRSKLARLCRRLIRVLSPDEDERTQSDDDETDGDDGEDANRASETAVTGAGVAAGALAVADAVAVDESVASKVDAADVHPPTD